MGTPCFLWGVAVVTAFSGYSFGLLQKSHSPSKAKSKVNSSSISEAENQHAGHTGM